MTRRYTSDGAPAPPALGRIGSFALCDAMASGSFSTVWSGYHVDRGFPVAIKVMRPAARGGSAAVTAMFERELACLGALNHASVIRVFDHGTLPESFLKHRDLALLPGAPYLVLERASGGSLEELEQPPTWPLVRRVALSLLEALSHAHARGIYHLDIKPANVLICDEDDMRPGIKLTDWGLAQAVRERTDGAECDALTGTPRFMPPEQFGGRWREYGPWTDLYALGGLLWTLATGESPFSGEFTDVFRGHSSHAPAAFCPRWAMPERLEEWLLTLLHKEPVHRFPTAADAACALRSLEEQMTPVPWTHSLTSDTDELVLDDAEWLGSDSVDIDGADPFGSVNPQTLDADSADPSQPVLFRSAAQQREDTSDDFSKTVFFAPEGQTDQFVVDVPLARAAARSSSSTFARRWPRTRLPANWAPPSIDENIPTEPSLFDVRQARMQGRVQERQALWELLRQAAAGQVPAVALVQGSAGSGKSRLLAELGNYAEESGGLIVLRAGGRSLREALQVFLRTQGLADRPALRLAQTRLIEYGMHGRRAHALARRLLSDEPPDDRFLALLMELISLLGRSRPVLVLLDDVDRHVDGLSLTARLLALSPPRVCVVATARRAEIRSQLGRAVSALESRVQLRIRLGRLTRAQQEALLSDLVWLPSNLIRRVSDWTQGNPGLAVDTVEHWVRHEQLRRGRGGYRVTPEGMTLLDAAGNRRFRTVRRSSEHLPTQPVDRPSTDEPGAVPHNPTNEPEHIGLRADTPP